MSRLMTNEYALLLAEVKERVRAAQYAAFRKKTILLTNKVPSGIKSLVNQLIS